MNLGIWLPHRLGDTLLLAGALQALRVAQPGTQVHLWADLEPGLLLQRCGLAHSVMEHGHGLRMPPFPLDALLLLAWDNAPLQHAAAGFGIPVVVAATPCEPAAMHQARYYHQLVGQACGGRIGPFAPRPLQVPAWLGEPAYQGVVLLHSGASSEDKRWGLARFEQLAQLVAAGGHRPVFVESPGDNYGEPAYGPTLSRSLFPMAGLIAGAAAYVGNDTGPTHLAGLLGVPTVALFGPSPPAQWQPVGPRVHVLQTCERRRALGRAGWCRHHDCFAALTPQLVYRHLQALL